MKKQPRSLKTKENSLLCIEMFNTKIFVPNENVIIGCYYIWMQKPFCIPPIKDYQNE